MTILIILAVLFIGLPVGFALLGALGEMNVGGWIYLGVCAALFFIYVVK